MRCCPVCRQRIQIIQILTYSVFNIIRCKNCNTLLKVDFKKVVNTCILFL